MNFYKISLKWLLLAFVVICRKWYIYLIVLFSFLNYSWFTMFCQFLPCRKLYFILFYLFIFLSFLGPHLRDVEAPRLGIWSDMAYARATATQDPSRVCYLHHNSRQCRILNPLSRPGIGPAASWFLLIIVNHWYLPQGSNSKIIMTSFINGPK